MDLKLESYDDLAIAKEIVAYAPIECFSVTEVDGIVYLTFNVTEENVHKVREYIKLSLKERDIGKETSRISEELREEKKNRDQRDIAYFDWEDDE